MELKNLLSIAFKKKTLMLSVVNPKQIKHFALPNLRRSKTDPLDADLIGRFGIALKPFLWNPPHPILEELKQISRERAGASLAPSEREPGL